jgi:hypothetical protein
VAGVSGVRVDPLDEKAGAGAQVTRLYEELSVLNRRAGALNQQGVTAKMPTREYVLIQQRVKQIEMAIERARAVANDGSSVPTVPVSDTQRRVLERARRQQARTQGNPQRSQRALARARRATASR